MKANGVSRWSRPPHGAGAAHIHDMNHETGKDGRRIALALAASLAMAGAGEGAGFSAAQRDGRIEVKDAGRVVLGWQQAPLAEPAGGAKFAASAFLHPLTTPSGFELTRIQPLDHRHHFGVWWPWKHLEVDGRKYNCWELQNGEGRQVGVSAKVDRQSDDEVVLALVNRHEVVIDGAYVPVLNERTKLRLTRQGADAYVLDLEISQEAVEGREVKVSAYRYSGFSWRGTGAWNADNGRMLTSEGRGRDDANHQPARWVMVDGPRPGGRATMLMMSAAAKQGDRPELLRVWNTKTLHGAPFVNFNPVVRESLAPDAGPVAQRRYRLILADRTIGPAEADKAWDDWK